MERLKQGFMLYVAALLLSGCAQLGVPPANTFGERLAAGYALNAQIRSTATELLHEKKLSSSDGQNVLEQTNNARTGLDIAREISRVNVESADKKLTAVRTVMTALQAYLTLRKGN